jgi:hypothetical protein
VSAGLLAAQRDWDSGAAALRRASRGLDSRTAAAVARAEAVVRHELTRRLGPSYNLEDLYREYLAADDWARGLISRTVAPLRAPTIVSPMLDAVFGHAARFARQQR